MSEFYDENGDLKKEKPLEPLESDYVRVEYKIPKQIVRTHQRMNMERKRID